MGVATPRWSELELAYGVSAVRSWDVLAADAADALASGGIDQQGTTHPLDASLVADQPVAKCVGPKFWQVTGNYKPANQPQGTPTTKPKVRWRRGTSSQPFDRDPDGNPILNSAGDLFDPSPEKEVGDRFFSVVRLERFYDLAKAEKFEDTVNDADFIFLKAYQFQKGQVRVESILPTGEYFYDATAVEIEYAFAVRRDGWKWRLIDQGRRGWYTDGADNKNKKAEIFGPDGTQVSSDILLDGGGAPFDLASYKVSRNGSTPINVPGPKGATVEKGQAAAFLLYDKFPEAPFAGLEL